MRRHPILTAREQALLIEPSAVCKANVRLDGDVPTRIFHVFVGNLILASDISPTGAWEKALKKLFSQWAIDHINGDQYDNRPENLKIVTRSKNLGSY